MVPINLIGAKIIDFFTRNTGPIEDSRWLG